MEGLYFCRAVVCSWMVLHCVSHKCPSHLHFTFSLQSSSRFLGHFFPLCPLKDDDNDEGSGEVGGDGGRLQKDQTKGVWIASLCSSVGILRILRARSVLKGKAPGTPSKDKGMLMMIGIRLWWELGHWEKGRHGVLVQADSTQLPGGYPAAAQSDLAAERGGCSLTSFPDGRTWLLVRGRAVQVLPVSYVRKYSSQLWAASPDLRI